jgi:hypothetical protein
MPPSPDPALKPTRASRTRRRKDEESPPGPLTMPPVQSWEGSTGRRWRSRRARARVGTRLAFAADAVVGSGARPVVAYSLTRAVLLPGHGC